MFNYEYASILQEKKTMYTKLVSTTWTSYWTTVSSVKPLILGVTLSENAPWVPGIPVAWHSFSFFSVMTIFEVTFCIFVLKCCDCSNSLVPFLCLLHNYIRRYIIIPWVNREAINNSHHDKTIISDNVVALLSSIWFILIVLFHHIASYYTHSFLSP